MISSVRSRIRSVFSDRGFAEILTGSIYALGARTAGMCLGLVSSVIVARLYSAEIMGITEVINSLLVLTTVFTVLGTNTSVLRLIPEHTARYSVASAFRVYRKTQYLVAAVSLVAGAALYASSDLMAATVFGKPGLAFFFALAAPFVAMKSLMLLSTHAVRGLRLIKTFALMQTLPALARLVFLVGGTLLMDEPNTPVYALLAGAALTALTGLCIMDRTFKRRMRPDDLIHPVKVMDIVAVSVPMLIGAGMYLVIGQTGVLMLGVFRSGAEVGYYAAAVRLAGVNAFLLSAINAMAAPKFSELFHVGRTDEMLRVARKATRLIFWTTSPMLLGLIVLGRPVLALLFGEPFREAYAAMTILALAEFVNSVSGSTGIFLNMTGHQKVFQNIMVVAASLNLALNLALIPRFGIEGAAVAGLVTVILWNSWALLYIRSKFGRTIGYFPLFSVSEAAKQ